MKNSIKLVTLLLTAGFYSACTRQLPPDTQSRIPLEGNWGLQLDTAGAGIAPDWLTKSCTDSLFLPGTTDMGKKGTYNTDMTLTTSLSREYVFEGKALYTKQVDIPEEWDGTSVRLVMERTKPTTIWIDGKEVGANNDISTAQQYDLSSYLFPGTHTVAILVDNGKPCQKRSTALHMLILLPHRQTGMELSVIFIWKAYLFAGSMTSSCIRMSRKKS